MNDEMVKEYEAHLDKWLAGEARLIQPLDFVMQWHARKFVDKALAEMGWLAA